MQEPKRIVSISVNEACIDLLEEMIERSGWNRNKIIKTAIKLLYKQEFEGKELDIKRLINIWE